MEIIKNCIFSHKREENNIAQFFLIVKFLLCELMGKVRSRKSYIMGVEALHAIRLISFQLEVLVN